MAQEKAKGSIIYEILIVILAAVLVVSIVYPKIVSQQEAANMKLCRERMSSILDAELQFLRYNNTYTDTLDEVISFLRTDERYASYIDSVIVFGLDSIMTKVEEFRAIGQTVQKDIPSATDTVMIDSLARVISDLKVDSRRLAGYVEYVHDQMKDLPNMPIEQLREAFLVVDSKKFTLDMDIIKNSVENGRLKDAMTGAQEMQKTMSSVIEQFAMVRDQVPGFRDAGLDSLHNCPAIYKPYRIVHIDTSVIKYLNIYCPIDSVDIENANSDFLKSKVGGLKRMNHGQIEKGEKSWESS